MSGLQPTVVGALIAGSAALIGYGASAWNTRATVRANRQAAQDQRLWEKRSALYEQILGAIRQMELWRMNSPESVVARTELADSLYAAVTLYASDAVTEHFQTLTEVYGPPPGLANPKTALIALTNLKAAVRSEIQRNEPPRRSGPIGMWRARVISRAPDFPGGSS